MHLRELVVNPRAISFISGGVILALVIRTLFRHFTNPLRDLPGPWLASWTRLWVWQQIRKNDFEQTNIALHQRYGPIVRLAPNEYSIDDPAALPIIYGHGTKFIKGPWYIAAGPPSQNHDVLVVSTFSDRNPIRHARSRRKVANAYSLTALLEMEKYIDSTSAVFFNQLDNFAVSGRSFNLGHWLQCYAFDVIGEVTFGRRVGFLDHGEDISNIMSNLLKSVQFTALLGVFPELHYPYRQLQIFLNKLKSNTSSRGAMLAFTKDQMSQSTSEKRPSDRHDYLSRFLSMNEASPPTITMPEILQVCLTQITAGSDTTAISLRAILYYLYRNPPTLQALRTELNEMTTTKGFNTTEPLTYQQCLQMPYLQAVIKEALRMHPATGLPLGRVVPDGGATICGRFFPAGTVVGVNSWVAHANKDVFGQDAQVFRPERWLVEKEEYARMDRYFVSFGLGSRTCLGKNLAMMEISKLVPQIIHRYDIEFENGKWNTANRWFVRQTGLDCTLQKVV